jgi:TPR repeat protein
VGEWAFNGTGGTKDQALAVEAWREAAKAGSGQAMNGLATAYLQGAGGVQKDEAQALEWLKKAAAADYPRALVTLSERYRDGNGVTRDVEKHVELLNRAIDLGSPSAPARLGYAYAQGIGVPQDLVKAGALYRKSADLGDPWGMYALGLYSFYGRGGVQKNAQEGIALLEKAAALGLESAKTTLARPEFSSEKTRLAAATPARAESRFSISADGQEVTDNKTRLVWRRCAEGMKAAGPVCEGSPRKFTHADAAKHAAAEASRSGKNWRLPEINDELGTIWDLAFKPPFNPSAFPSTPQGHFWSSTKNTAMSDGSCSWVFDFHESEGYGAAAGCSPNNATHLVRLVRTAP